MSQILDNFFDVPQVCRMSRRLTQAEIDNEGIMWIRFPNCDKCNPNHKAMMLETEVTGGTPT